jgi:hypothetical protein
MRCLSWWMRWCVGPSRCRALSLEPEFRRGHGGLYDALSGGRIEVAGLRALLLNSVSAGRDGLVWVAGDVSGWPRPEAVCSPQRVAMYDKSARSSSGHPVTSGWPFLVLAALQWGPSSWTAPVDAVRLGPHDTLSGQALAAMRRILDGLAGAGRGERVGFVFDAEFDLMAYPMSWPIRPTLWAGCGPIRSFTPRWTTQPGQRGRRRRHGAADHAQRRGHSGQPGPQRHA